MINYKITLENSKFIDDHKGALAKAFPGRDPNAMYDILQLYDEAYLSSKEYFAYYFPMTTQTIVDYVNDNKLGRVWQFVTDAIFDEGEFVV